MVVFARVYKAQVFCDFRIIETTHASQRDATYKNPPSSLKSRDQKNNIFYVFILIFQFVRMIFLANSCKVLVSTFQNVCKMQQEFISPYNRQAHGTYDPGIDGLHVYVYEESESGFPLMIFRFWYLKTKISRFQLQFWFLKL